jgi:hypothetical protein
MGIIDKAEETVTNTGPHVLEALRKIKLLLVGIPIICVIVGIVSQKVLPERNIATATFKIGTFATPANPEPVPLAGESQMKARLRANSTNLRGEYSDALLITTLLDNDVVTPTATGLGPALTKDFLAAVIQREIDFQNGRLEKLQSVQNQRRESLKGQLGGLNRRIDVLSVAQTAGDDPVALLALQQEIDNARARAAVIRNELNTMSLLNASDLFIDTTQFIRAPFIVASSNWYRPVLYGAIGLAVGLLLTLVLAIIAIIRALTRKKDS